MWIMMVLSYTIVSIIDTGKFTKQESRGQLMFYIVLMIVSCAIGIANGYVDNMPSPADPIKNIVDAVIGS